jgi:hypothetical protein
VTSGFLSNFQDSQQKTFRGHSMTAQASGGDNNSENGEIRSQFSFDSKASSSNPVGVGWLAFALRNG